MTPFAGGLNTSGSLPGKDFSEASQTAVSINTLLPPMPRPVFEFGTYRRVDGAVMLQRSKIFIVVEDERLS
jgi:hypothetical protein